MFIIYFMIILQYFRVYSPVAFGKKTDKTGDYIRKYLPQLAKYPEKFIYEPWKAPLALQQACGCVIGRDYPSPIVDHDVVSKQNMDRMKEAYALHGGGDPDEEGNSKPSTTAAAANASSSSSSSSSTGKPTSAAKKTKESGAMDKFIVKKPKL